MLKKFEEVLKEIDVLNEMKIYSHLDVLKVNKVLHNIFSKILQDIEVMYEHLETIARNVERLNDDVFGMGERVDTIQDQINEYKTVYISEQNPEVIGITHDG